MEPSERLNTTVTIQYEDVPISTGERHSYTYSRFIRARAHLVMRHVVIFFKITNYYPLFVRTKPKTPGNVVRAPDT